MNTPTPPDDLWSARLGLVSGDRRLIAFAQDAALRYTWVYRSPAAGNGGLALGPAAVGKTDAEALPFGDSSRLTHHKEAALASVGPYHFGFRTWIGGRSYLYEVSLEPVRGAGGAVVGLLGVAEDVTQTREAAHEAARTLTEMQRRIDHAVHDARRRVELEDDAFSAAVSAAAATTGLRLCEEEEELPTRIMPAPGDAGELTRLLYGSLREIRRRTLDAARLAGLPEGRALDLLTAVGEVAMNAVRHAQSGEGQACCDPEAGLVQVWITDKKHPPPPHPLRTFDGEGWRRAPRRGLRLAILTSDHLHLYAGPEGTTVVVEKQRDPPEPGIAGLF